MLNDEIIMEDEYEPLEWLDLEEEEDSNGGEVIDDDGCLVLDEDDYELLNSIDKEAVTALTIDQIPRKIADFIPRYHAIAKSSIIGSNAISLITSRLDSIFVKKIDGSNASAQDFNVDSFAFMDKDGAILSVLAFTPKTSIVVITSKNGKKRAFMFNDQHWYNLRKKKKIMAHLINTGWMNVASFLR